MLGLSRGAVLYWESEIRPVPRAVELACQDCCDFGSRDRSLGQRDTAFADGPISQVDILPCGDLVL